jgi:hypothetical protein
VPFSTGSAVTGTTRPPVIATVLDDTVLEDTVPVIWPPCHC